MIIMEAVRRASSFLFYLISIPFLVVLVLVQRGFLASIVPYLHIADLPMILIAMLYGGSSLYTSLSRGKKSLVLLMTIFIPLGVLFAVFCWFNFALPFPTF